MGDQGFDLFNYQDFEGEVVEEEVVEEEPLNGCYYDGTKGVYVSYVMGRRHLEFDGKGFDKEWQERVKRDRVI